MDATTRAAIIRTAQSLNSQALYREAWFGAYAAHYIALNDQLPPDTAWHRQCVLEARMLRLEAADLYRVALAA